MVKLLMSWDIVPGREPEYFEFIVKEWAPGLQKLGIETSEVWYTLYGDCEQMLVGGLAPDAAAVHKVLATPEWKRLEDRLKEYVSDFAHKLIPAKGGFQL